LNPFRSTIKEESYQRSTLFVEQVINTINNVDDHCCDGEPEQHCSLPYDRSPSFSFGLFCEVKQHRGDMTQAEGEKVKFSLWLRPEHDSPAHTELVKTILEFSKKANGGSD
jgi:hypothetical protein